MISAILFISFFIFLILGVPIGICLGLSSVCAILYSGTSLTIVATNMYSGISKFLLLAIPFFVLSGNIMAKAGISKRLIKFVDTCVGHKKGGIAIVCVIVACFFGAISGSGPATTAAVGSMCIPFMVEMGYEKRWSAGLIAVAGGLGVIIPPSIPFVLYSLATGVSTGDLFLAGVIPGILIGLFMMAYAVIFCITKGEDKQRIRAKMSELRGNGFLKLFADSFFALLCPIIVLGGIYSGIVTPTEAACVSVFYALFVSLVVYRSISLKDLIPFLASSVKTYGGLAFVLAFATAFGRVLSLTRATKVIEDFIVGNFTTSWSVLSVLVILFLILGMVMDTGPAIVILAPILLPAVQALGVDSVHFGVILVCCLSIGLATPPFGLDLFVAGNLAEEPPMAVAKRAVPFIISFLLALALITYVEPVSLALLGR